MGRDRTGQDLVELFAFQAAAFDKALDGGGQHVLVGLVGVERVRATEGNANSAGDDDFSQALVGHQADSSLDSVSARSDK